MSRKEPSSGQLATAAIIAGVLAGIPSGVPKIAICGCLFVLVGGLFAGFILSRQTRGGITPGEGSIVGAISGVVATVVSWSLTHFVFAAQIEAMKNQVMATQPAGSQAMMQRIMEMSNSPISVVISAIVMAVVGLLGGLIAALIWRAPKQGVQ